MTSVQFKLTKSGGGLTRRFHSPALPSWFELASKIESLFDISIEKIGVAYIDNDGDEVTLSSEDELRDFYAVSYKPSQTIKLTVQDLGSLRHSNIMSSQGGSETAQNNGFRNTFGGPEMLFDDWQQIPRGLGDIYAPPTEGLQAYIVPVDSDAPSFSKGDTSMDSDMSSLGTPIMGKGKGKGKARDELMTPDANLSTVSLLTGEEDVKYPVHVMDVGDEGMIAPPPVATEQSLLNSPHSTIMPVQAESTPVTSVKSTLPVHTENPFAGTEDLMSIDNATADPPLPDIDFQPSPPAPSLTNDVASFLNSLVTVFSSHPELSEGLRNITRNTTNGSYWSAHRDAVARAAEEIRRSATEEGVRVAGQVRRDAEEEAGRRVADALGGLMKMFGDLTAAPRDSTTGGPPTSTNEAGNASAQPTTVDYGEVISNNFGTSSSAREGSPPPDGRPRSWGRHGRFAPPSGPPPPPGGPHGRRRGGPHGQGPHGHGPPPPRMHTPFGPPLGPPHRAQWGSPFWARPPPDGPGGPTGLSGPGGPHGHHQGPGPFSWAFGPRHAPPSPQALPWWFDTAGQSANAPANENLTPTQLREKVETAKAQYKKEKELYRKAREERKASAEGKAVPTEQAEVVAEEPKDVAEGSQAPKPMPATVTHIVSNARGPYPQLEMVSVPRNHRATTLSPTEIEAFSTRKITRKLADMGFTENAYPSIATRIKELIPAGKPLSKDDEDNIVTTLLEEFLAIGPKPQPSTSALAKHNKDRDLPGAWN